ncbi:glycosyl transferase [Salinibacterium xinjiangense]|uniref:Glycosyltransferase involved in cell wall bisynthesis n=1 Tax=Salinibacterium xinjiangense TaxID=386302 RepID=A0A2C8Y6U0_9MICO|nr:glycosyltransferase family 2 protein [Salinibacterium xinjiangense]GGK95405.1 glycosyl transferase [Salinibacterium xinjiangense]SOE45804.1 Glycosyltransferase involved in cell wall bisynthesis [Salinibacterium xinjiangense]
MLRISVALCTYNGANFIEEQLRSILEQRMMPQQLVISDDGSRDDTLDRIARVLASLPHQHPGRSVSINILKNAIPLGVVKNFEQALLACDGELVALCDQDDVWHPDRIEAAVAHFRRDDEVMLVHSDARLVDESGSPIGHSLFYALRITDAELAEVRQGDELAVLLRRNLVTGATAMFRRAVVALAAPFPEPWVHDEWLAVIAASIGRGEIVMDELVDYRQHSANQIGVSRLGLLGRVGRVLEPRNGRNRHLAERAQVLVSRLDSLGDAVRPDARDRAREKLVHLRVRARFSRVQLLRLLPVLKEVSTGRYARYSRGAGDILRDLLQPAGNERR